MRVSEISEAVFDPTGWGATPYGTDIDYFGLQIKMRPSMFLRLAQPMTTASGNSKVEQHIESGGSIAPAILFVDIPGDWSDGKFTSAARVVGHEGRNRMAAILKLEGDGPVPVNLLPRGKDREWRRRNLTPEIIDALSSGVISEVGKTISGPIFDPTSALEEMALSTYQPMGDFEKPGPFRGADKRLIPHPANQLKTQKFFEKTPYDFRLFFSNLTGTGKYSEYGPMSSDQIRTIFKDQAEQIIDGSGDAITVVFVGNKGDSKVMMTPWIMAHRFGHAIQAGNRSNRGWSVWGEAEKHFFTAINSTLEEYYGKAYRGANTYNTAIKWDLTPEYNALFNAIGTQRSSRSGNIRRPSEFLYELFAQYLGTGKITLNPLPTNLTYGRKAWGRPTKYLGVKQEFRREDELRNASDALATDMEFLFSDVLSNSVGKIFVM